MIQNKKDPNRNLIERDRQYIWHPFTQMLNAPDPIPILKGKGSLLWDEDGTEYIDAISSWWVNVHGHAHPYIAEKVSRQLNELEHVIFAGFTHPPAVNLAERLVAHLPLDKGRLFFSDNGSTAVEVAIKMALQYWHNKGIPKTKIIALEHAYHGDTFGSMSVSARGVFNKPFEQMFFDVLRLPFPSRDNYKDTLETLKGYVEQEDVAAFIFEPLVLGAGGMLMYTPEILTELMKCCRQAEVLLIADEVMTGFGRTGSFFATHQTDIGPDIMSMSKGLTGGTMAMGITACREFIYNAFLSEDKMKTFFHGHSYTANPIACACALASLDLMENEETWSSIRSIEKSHKEFSRILAASARAENIRVTGTILAFDILTDNSVSYFHSLRDKAYDYFISNGVLLRPLGNTIYIMPPYCILPNELDKVYKTIQSFLTGLEN